VTPGTVVRYVIVLDKPGANLFRAAVLEACDGAAQPFYTGELMEAQRFLTRHEANESLQYAREHVIAVAFSVNEERQP